MKFKYDYTKTMMMKLRMADPDCKGGSKVHFDAESTLEIIKTIDNLTLGTPKILYLVGWQYLGHDDKYPAFFEVNEGIKRERDESASDSLLYLIREGKKYNTTVSLHINFADAYQDSPIFDEYVENNALIRNRRGRPAGIEKYNNKTCYKISYKEEWESGLFHKRIDKLLSLLPIEELGTVHVDNFQCYVNRKPAVSAEEMMSYRDKMIAYLADKGVDITSEFTYREGKGTRIAYGKITRDVTPYRYPIACLDKIPAVWWTDKMKLREYYDYYPHIYGGGMPKNNKALNMFYGNIHGEDIFEKIQDNKDWQKDFIRQFCMINLPFYYLNGKTRVELKEKGLSQAIYSDGTVTRADGVITERGKTVRRGKMAVTATGKITLSDGEVFLPYNDGYVAYSDIGGRLSYSIDADGEEYGVYEITGDGLKNTGNIAAEGGEIVLNAKAKTAYYISANK